MPFYRSGALKEIENISADFISSNSRKELCRDNLKPYDKLQQNFFISYQLIKMDSVMNEKMFTQL